MTPEHCPCGTGLPLSDCCGRVLAGAAPAATAEALMRSRFTAFAVGDQAYLLRSWHPDTRPRRLRLDDSTRWERLEVVGKSGGGMLHAEGTVEFRAHYREGGETGVMHERSRFVRHEGAWVYWDALS
ncbi:YchJ family protein [Actinokineospora sp. G85]|uniref:YchJ family protein n=1 Tax=Actinokineospora sp. G85 TaxID=3406626 RepID=UPI003C755730